MKNNDYRHLHSLLESELDLPAEKHNVIGWKIKSEANAYLGETIDLLYDSQSMTVRYLIVELSGNGMGLEGKRVMIPVGIATLQPQEDEIILPNLHIDQFIAFPAYQPGAINPDTEQQIRDIIGSPAALRIEETIAEFDHDRFYAHHHFNSANFFNKEKDDLANPSPPIQQEENQTIHQLIVNSKAKNLHAAILKPMKKFLIRNSIKLNLGYSQAQPITKATRK